MNRRTFLRLIAAVPFVGKAALRASTKSEGKNVYMLYRSNLHGEDMMTIPPQPQYIGEDTLRDRYEWIMGPNMTSPARRTHISANRWRIEERGPLEVLFFGQLREISTGRLLSWFTRYGPIGAKERRLEYENTLNRAADFKEGFWAKTDVPPACEFHGRNHFEDGVLCDFGDSQQGSAYTVNPHSNAWL